MCLICTYKSATIANNWKGMCMFLSLDFTNVFDTANNDFLIHKLKIYDIKVLLLNA